VDNRSLVSTGVCRVARQLSPVVSRPTPNLVLSCIQSIGVYRHHFYTGCLYRHHFRIVSTNTASILSLPTPLPYCLYRHRFYIVSLPTPLPYCLSTDTAPILCLYRHHSYALVSVDSPSRPQLKQLKTAFTRAKGGLSALVHLLAAWLNFLHLLHLKGAH
jgi:hypothetical protein